jgi:DNA mismatch endonuclease (patch repair protein)
MVIFLADIVDHETRSRMMSTIKSKDTKMEIKVRLWLFHHGIRYRKYNKKILGKPEISVAKYKIAIFINGCFWHGHKDCKDFINPKSNVEFWTKKIARNKERDEKIKSELENKGCHVYILWECELKNDFGMIMNDLYSGLCKNICFYSDNKSTSCCT